MWLYSCPSIVDSNKKHSDPFKTYMRLCHSFCLKPSMTSHEPTRSYMTNHCSISYSYLPCFLSWKSQMPSCLRASLWCFSLSLWRFFPRNAWLKFTSPPCLLRGYWSQSHSLIILYKIKLPPSVAALSNPFIFIFLNNNLRIFFL